MNYSNIINLDMLNGPGIRISLFVSGCEHFCKGCFNPESWNFDFGEKFTEHTLRKIIELMKPDYISGFTLLGGEPLHPKNQKDIFNITQTIKKTYPNKKIWCFTGYLLDNDIFKNMYNDNNTPYIKDIINNIDVLVDGKFILSLKDISLKFRGSSNQRIIDIHETLTILGKNSPSSKRSVDSGMNYPCTFFQFCV